MKANYILISAVALTGMYSCKSLDNNPVVKENSTKGKTTIDLAYLDKNVRPQDDFFLFSNGTWIANNPVPPSESRWGSFNELDKSNKEKLTSILESCKKNATNPGTDNFILGNYYASFLNMTKRNELGIQPIQSDLDKIKGLKSKSDIVTIVAEQHILGVNMLFSFGVGQDLKNVNGHISYLGQSGIGLPNRDYYFSENKKEILQKYTDHIKKCFVLIGHSAEDAEKMAANVISFETKLADKMMAPAELRIPEKTYNKHYVYDAVKMFGKFDFETYLKKIGSSTFDTLIVAQPEFITQVSTLLAEQPMEVWKDYLTWKVVKHYSGSLNDALVNENFNFYGKVLSGKSEMKPVTERAIDEITNKDFGELLGKKFVEKYYSDQAQARVNEMVDNLLIVFRERIEALDWMSTQTKQEALTKLNAIGRKLGFPSKWEDYSALNFKNDAYVQNKKEEYMFSHYKNLGELNKPVDKEKWGMPAHMVNAYYHPLLNEIAFPAGIMQPPFFDENAEDAVNYGRIGMVIGHEFTHGFDDMGSKFAADGSFNNWWSEEDRVAFEKKTMVLGETFAAFCPIDGHCVNPELTMGENIADLGGLTMAFYAYKRTTDYKSGKMKEGFTPAQRFFIAYAQLWKINYTEEEMKNRIANDPHSPGMYRVNGPLKNCPEFFEAFEVKEGDPMRNSKEKVSRIW